MDAVDTVRLQAYMDVLERKRVRRRERRKQKKRDAGYKYAQEENCYLAGGWVEPEGHSTGIYFQEGYARFHDELSETP